MASLADLPTVGPWSAAILTVCGIGRVAELHDRIRYLTRMGIGRFRRARLLCPNCGHSTGQDLSRKYVISALRRCEACRLLFRLPTDDPDWNDIFYNNEYEQGFTTKLPLYQDLTKMISGAFAGSDKDYQKYIDIIDSVNVRPGDRLFDFGCSWGYGSWQLAHAGFEVWASEIGRNRAAFARDHLSVRIVDSLTTFAANQAGTFDVFFSAHVLEHVPAPHDVIELAKCLLKPGGLFVAFVPNGSAPFRAKEPSWRKLWGRVHPNLIDDEFLAHTLTAWPIIFGSIPVSAKDKAKLHRPKHTEPIRLDLSHPELFCIAAKPSC